MKSAQAPCQTTVSDVVRSKLEVTGGPYCRKIDYNLSTRILERLPRLPRRPGNQRLKPNSPDMNKSPEL